MKKKMNKVMIGTVVLGAVVAAQGALIASESFEADATGTGGIYNTTGTPAYSALGSDSNKAVTVGNIGFNAGNVWLNNTGTFKANTSVALTHNGVVGGSATGAVLISGSSNKNSNRLLAAMPVVSSSYYFSGLVKCNGGSVLDDGQMVAMGVMDSIAADTFDISNGIHIGLRKAGSVTYLAAYANNTAYNLLALDGTTVGNVYQIVLKLDVNASGNETLTAWYAENSDAALTLGLTATDVGDIWQDAGDLDTFTVQVNSGRGQEARVDEFRFGTELTDVTSLSVGLE